MSQSLVVVRCARMTKTVKLCAQALMPNAQGQYVLPVEGVKMTLLQSGAEKESSATGKSGLVEFSARVPQGDMEKYSVRADLGPGVSAKYEFRDAPTQNVERGNIFDKTGKAYVHKMTFYFRPKAWIGVRVLNEAGAALTGVKVSIQWPDKSAATKTLTRGDLQADGTYRLEHIPEGAYQVSLTEVDRELWAPQSRGGAGGAMLFAAFPPYAAAPGDMHTAAAGDCIWSLAVRYNVTANAIWDDGLNSLLSGKFKNGYTLLPGLKVKIPKPRGRQESCNTNAAYDFVVRDQPREVVVRFMDQGKLAVAGIGGKVKINGRPDLDVTTDGSGEIRFKAPYGVNEAEIDVPDIGIESYRLMLGGLSPIESGEGVRQRLINLGYYIEPGSGEVKDKAAELQKAVKAFQNTNGIAPDEPKPNGTVNQATMDALVKACGA